MPEPTVPRETLIEILGLIRSYRDREITREDLLDGMARARGSHLARAVQRRLAAIVAICVAFCVGAALLLAFVYLRP